MARNGRRLVPCQTGCQATQDKRVDLLGPKHIRTEPTKRPPDKIVLGAMRAQFIAAHSHTVAEALEMYGVGRYIWPEMRPLAVTPSTWSNRRTQSAAAGGDRSLGHANQRNHWAHSSAMKPVGKGLTPASRAGAFHQRRSERNGVADAVGCRMNRARGDCASMAAARDGAGAHEFGASSDP